MKIREYQKKFILTGPAIDEFSDLLEETFNQIEMEPQNRLRIRLSLEEALLRMRDHFGEESEVMASIKRQMGRIIIQVEMEGDPFNPLSSEENELEDLCSSLLTSVGLSPQYSFSGHRNMLRIALPTPGINPVLKIVLTILGGILIGLVGTNMISGESMEKAVNLVMNPIYDVWIRILNIMSGPVIFFMVITTMLDAAKISQRGGNSRFIVVRYFLLSFIMVMVALIVALWFYPITSVKDNISGDVATNILDQILQIIPRDFFTPFVESNTPQLLVMAFVLGSALNTIGSQVRNLSRIVRQINMVGMKLAEWISKLVPYFAAVLVGLEIWQKRTRTLTGMWGSLLIALAVSAVCILFGLIIVSRRKDVEIRKLILKLKDPFLLAVRTGSLDAAFGQTEKSCVKDLGISKEFTTLSLPNGLVLYMPVSAIGTIVFMVFTAMKYDIHTSPIWYVMAVVLAVVLFVATPPVPGANLLAYTVIFAQLGIPGQALIDAMIFDIIFGIFASAGNQLLLQLELILQSDRIGMLRRNILQR